MLYNLSIGIAYIITKRRERKEAALMKGESDKGESDKGESDKGESDKSESDKSESDAD